MSSSSFAPPLPVGWTEHTGLRFYFSYVIILLNGVIDPGGHFYYFNSQTQESTYVRPLPPFFPSSHASHPLRNKERPLVKTPIPGTDWLRVKTTEGNTFYSHKTRKESVWVVPEEIESDLKAFEQQEREREVMLTRNEPDGENDLENSQDETTKHEGRKSVKRKVDHSVPLDEVEIMKKAKFGEEEESEESDASEEDWQREAAAQLAEEAAEERQRVEEEQRRAKEAEAEAKRTIAVDIPQKVNLSLDEAKALFKVKVLVISRQCHNLRFYHRPS